MTDRVVVESDALRRLLEAAARASARDPALARAVSRLLASSAPAPEPRTAVSVKEAAAALGVSVKTVRRRVEDGSLPARKLGSRVLIHADVVRSGQERSGVDSRVAEAVTAADDAGAGGSRDR